MRNELASSLIALAGLIGWGLAHFSPTSAAEGRFDLSTAKPVHSQPDPTALPALEGRLSASIDQQERCAKQAALKFKEFNWETNSSYQNHFHSELNRCLMVARHVGSANGSVVNQQVLLDAYQNEELGSLIEIVKGSNTSLLSCSVREQKCRGPDEFGELLKRWME